MIVAMRPDILHATPEYANGLHGRPARQLQRQVLMQMGLASLVVLLAAAFLHSSERIALPAPIGLTGALTAIGVWLLIAVVVWRGLAWHQHLRFGAANSVTLIRAAGTAVLAGLVPLAEPLLSDAASGLSAIVSMLALALLLLDGVDGYLARLTGLVSAFGARFDMEIDALLALVLSIVIWQSGEAGIWILGLGVLRYLFVLASVWSAPLRGALFPSMRRKLVCVLQIATLCAILSPLVQPPLSQGLGVLTLLALVGSFARDIHWLYRHQSRV